VQTTAPTSPRRATRSITLDHAQELLARAATLHLDHRSLLVRCRLGGESGWWPLEDALSLLHLGDSWWEVAGVGDQRHLAVADGIDVYRFDVT
jgi:hypothetical protein